MNIKMEFEIQENDEKEKMIANIIGELFTEILRKIETIEKIYKQKEIINWEEKNGKRSN